jgi:hypothetical protein
MLRKKLLFGFIWLVKLCLFHGFVSMVFSQRAIFTVSQASEKDRYTTLFQPPIVHFKNFLTQSGALMILPSGKLT